MLVGSQLRTKYDRLKWRLDDARAKTAEAKAVYDAAKALRPHPSFLLRREVWRVLTQDNPAYPNSKNENMTT